MSEELRDRMLQAELEPQLIDEFISLGRIKKVSAGQVVVSPGSQNTEMPIVLDGLLKVMRQDNDQREILLYYLEGGETCAMSITCCLEGKKSSFKLIAEEDSTLWMIPVAHMDSWVQKYPMFRRFVFAAYQSRFDELLETIDSITFLKMDERLYKFLLDTKQATGSFSINMTHEQIAKQLNTSRVVISRLLKQLEGEGKIEQHRNKVEVL
ncbi:MAG: Crp/Fnr family transcriptional regulator [bacterium]|jgi:CRP/FNR family transcriptional regulator|nr:Crp/Fnr family transcriptional regulator [bacterium]